ncbi:uncharacterized protein BJ171DRAFT_475785 [Polychytrium aggregatum]|uniref:uncharacterized protein n=1 Tax=Polychytrium aggregatum TaxID=110093 RepID=UPI0022FF1F21|nr:uncharacterized protein BJ171DRAFT_475785 [Polychytrium aggregatum]KAI9203423.1 hypothetical protein BJ171DRAFT_475785 [Polychytrium aggregatum]
MSSWWGSDKSQQQQSEQLKSDLTGAKQALSALEAQLASERAASSAIGTQLEQANSVRAQLEQEIDSLKASLDDKTKALRQAEAQGKARILELQESLDAQGKTLATLRKNQQPAHNDKLPQLERALDAEKQRIKTLEAEVSLSKSELQMSRDSLKHAQDALQRATLVLDTVQQTAGLLKDKVFSGKAKVSDSIASSTKAVEKLCSEILALQRQSNQSGHDESIRRLTDSLEHTKSHVLSWIQLSIDAKEQLVKTEAALEALKQQKSHPGRSEAGSSELQSVLTKSTDSVLHSLSDLKELVRARGAGSDAASKTDAEEIVKRIDRQKDELKQHIQNQVSTQLASTVKSSLNEIRTKLEQVHKSLEATFTGAVADTKTSGDHSQLLSTYHEHASVMKEEFKALHKLLESLAAKSQPPASIASPQRDAAWVGSPARVKAKKGPAFQESVKAIQSILSPTKLGHYNKVASPVAGKQGKRAHDEEEDHQAKKSKAADEIDQIFETLDPEQTETGDDSLELPTSTLDAAGEDSTNKKKKTKKKKKKATDTASVV